MIFKKMSFLPENNFPAKNVKMSPRCKGMPYASKRNTRETSTEPQQQQQHNNTAAPTNQKNHEKKLFLGTHNRQNSSILRACTTCVCLQRVCLYNVYVCTCARVCVCTSVCAQWPFFGVWGAPRLFPSIVLLRLH